MSSDPSQGVMRFSTRDLPESERLPFWREVFARQIAHIDIEHQSDDPLEAEAVLLALPGLALGWCSSNAPACWTRTPELVADGDDCFALLLPLEGGLLRSQRGYELEAVAGEAVGILHAEPAQIRFRQLRHIALMVPRLALSKLVADLEDASTRLIPRDSEPLRLLHGYLSTLAENPGVADPALSKLVVTHIQDLIALAIGATSDGQAVARGRGLRAARLCAIKTDIADNPHLDLGTVAARQHVTPRYVQMLFADEGTTFTAYGLGLRLQQAHAMLTDCRYAGLPISTIVFQAGFGDLSYFNRCFKRRYGHSPSELRSGSPRNAL